MNIDNSKQSILDYFKNKKWNYLIIEGSVLGNSSFLLTFIDEILFNENERKGILLKRLISGEENILYVRSESFLEKDTVSSLLISSIEKVSLIEKIFNKEAFDYRNIIRMLQNRRYSYLIMDDIRKDDSDRFEKFNEVLDLCRREGIKVITSVTDNRQLKSDYFYYEADLIINVNYMLLERLYSIEIQDKDLTQYKKYSLNMR